jgi:CheY-like chemotaxis protein
MVLVLLVDDDGTALSRSADALLAAGHQVVTARNGQDALDEIEWNRPDLVVCDSNMPVMDGWDLVRALRDDSRYEALPIVFMSSVDDPVLRLSAFRNGVDDYLPKPFEPEELVQRIGRLLGRSSIVSRPITLAPSSDIQGRLQHFSLKAVFELVAGEKKSGLLVVSERTSRCRFWFRDGDLVKASRDHGPGGDWQRCVREVSGWHTGEFWFSEKPVDEPDEIKVSLAEVVGEHFDGSRYGRKG